MNSKKTTYITIRMTEEEKKEIKENAKSVGLDNISAYLLMLYRLRKK